ncbi:MAG: dgkA1 [Rhizobacter sp.]|jgi:diacylglycerol kinase (ATP)|nr:dgkA1 [Rhizobacter sp.]
MNQATPPVGEAAAPGSAFKGRSGLGRLSNAARFSWSGLKAAWRFEAAFRQEVVVGIPLIVLALAKAPTRLHAVALIGTILFAWVVELLNSGIEALADAVSLQRHPLLGRAKDLGSAAVMLSVGFAAITWALVFWP